ncbi:MAG: hypothetical protein DCC75_02240 [Proteobacteria bacterium]|nr:MAG: hypothetical protein DCC75_02240 [Pseudomonadota bacterium]
MNTVTPSQQQAPPSALNRVRVVYPLIFSLICAFTAELLLKDFMEHDTELMRSALGRVTAVFIGLYIVQRFAILSFRLYRPNLKNLVCIFSVLLGCIILVWLGKLLSISLSTYLSSVKSVGAVPAETFYFAIPFATGGFLLQAVLGLQYGMVFSVSLSLIAAIYFPGTPIFSLYALVTSLIACLSLSHLRSRSAYLRAGLNVSLFSLVLCLAALLMKEDLVTAAAPLGILAALIGGILCAFLASGITPIVEHVGGYVTDMRLIEMATLDHPLLKELSIQAPGTWNHSMVMGMMVEAAADAIGANAVLARVGSYFHDIGKTKKPLYFVENQGSEENRHDKLSPSMSALIIRSHVKDGIELARKHGMPSAIEDMIPQHHGTSRIEFFYEKARNEAEEAGHDPESVDESLYRYPGPKPQTREAGILMLADGIEAAARTLSEPSFDRIQGMVQKMINKVFASGELNECDLTLKDLHIIAKCFTRILSGIYHQRIAYAEPAEKTKESEIDVTSQPVSATEEKPEEEGSKEDLKRLGL